MWEQKERERRGGRGGEGVWGVRGGRGVRVGRLMGVLGRYKAVLYLSKMSARRRRAKIFGLKFGREAAEILATYNPPLVFAVWSNKGGL